MACTIADVDVICVRTWISNCVMLISAQAAFSGVSQGETAWKVLSVRCVCLLALRLAGMEAKGKVLAPVP